MVSALNEPFPGEFPDRFPIPDEPIISWNIGTEIFFCISSISSSISNSDRPWLPVIIIFFFLFCYNKILRIRRHTIISDCDAQSRSLSLRPTLPIVRKERTAHSLNLVDKVRRTTPTKGKTSKYLRISHIHQKACTSHNTCYGDARGCREGKLRPTGGINKNINNF